MKTNYIIQLFKKKRESKEIYTVTIQSGFHIIFVGEKLTKRPKNLTSYIEKYPFIKETFNVDYLKQRKYPIADLLNQRQSTFNLLCDSSRWELIKKIETEV